MAEETTGGTLDETEFDEAAWDDPEVPVEVDETVLPEEEDDPGDDFAEADGVVNDNMDDETEPEYDPTLNESMETVSGDVTTNWDDEKPCYDDAKFPYDNEPAYESAGSTYSLRSRASGVLPDWFGKINYIKRVKSSITSANSGWMITQKAMPSPEKKRYTKDIPYTDGVIDFSRWMRNSLGQKLVFYNNRTIEYTFVKFFISNRSAQVGALKFCRWLNGFTVASQMFDTGSMSIFTDVTCTSAVPTINGTIVEVKAVFEASPYRIPVNGFNDDGSLDISEVLVI